MKSRPTTAAWLDEFAACVRNRNPARGRELFAPHVRAYGTRAASVDNLTELVERQWSRVWFNTRYFHFLPESIEELPADDGSQVCVIALWESEGLTADGHSFSRGGRCTLVLQRADDAPLGYLAVHSHFSKTPPDEL